MAAVDSVDEDPRDCVQALVSETDQSQPWSESNTTGWAAMKILRETVERQ